MSDRNGIEALTETIGRYNDAWNAQDLDAIMAMHAPDMIFANHTAGESARGEDVRGHIAQIFESWPDMRREPCSGNVISTTSRPAALSDSR